MLDIEENVATAIEAVPDLRRDASPEVNALMNADDSFSTVVGLLDQLDERGDVTLGLDALWLCAKGGYYANRDRYHMAFSALFEAMQTSENEPEQAVELLRLGYVELMALVMPSSENDSPEAADLKIKAPLS